MRQNRKYVLVAALCLAGVAVAQEKKPAKKEESGAWSSHNIVYQKAFEPITKLRLEGKDNKSATIDFGGDKVIYSGDLSVDESAKVFFDAVMTEWQGRCAAAKPKGETK